MRGCQAVAVFGSMWRPNCRGFEQHAGATWHPRRVPNDANLFATCAGIIPTVLLALVINALAGTLSTGGLDPVVRARWRRDYRRIFIILTVNAALTEAVCLLALSGTLPELPLWVRVYVAVSTIVLVATLAAALVRQTIFSVREAEEKDKPSHRANGGRSDGVDQPPAADGGVQV